MFTIIISQVPLGVLLRDENKLEEMVDVLVNLQQYVPLTIHSKEVEVPSTEETMSMQEAHIHQILFGGDFLTAKRARGAQRIRSNSTHDYDKLKGFLPVSEDWHTKQCFLSVSDTICKTGVN